MFSVNYFFIIQPIPIHYIKKMLLRVLLLFLLTYSVSTSTSAQDVDTLRLVEMDDVIVTADRYKSIRSQSTGAISVLKRNDIQQLAGVQTLGGILRQVPGFTLLQLDGIGYDVQPIIRGFYGGGEAEYVLLMVDNQPVNALETGLVNWDQIPLAAIESVEVLRGGASSLYGDAAIGGVINIITASDAPSSYQLSIAGGSHGTLKASGSSYFSLGSRRISSYGNYESTDGYREHANRTLAGLGMEIDLLNSERLNLRFSASLHSRKYDVPGPLTSQQIAQDRVQESPFFQYDNNDEDTRRLALRGIFNLSQSSELLASVILNERGLKGARTLPLSAEFADVKWRQFDASRSFVSVQWVSQDLIANDHLTVGGDLQNGELDVAWYDMVTGPAEVFNGFDGSIGDLSTRGSGSRQSYAAFLQYDVELLSQLKLSAGLRYDRIADSYTPEGGSKLDPVHTALSPKFGLNVRYISSADHIGNWYANVAQSFKTATMDQLFGQRLIPIAMPGISISNSNLKPQRGISIETGVYHRAVLIPEKLTGDLTLSLYHMDMEDELDFQFETFQYENIASSRHRGVELGVQLERIGLASLRFNYTLQHVTYRAGEHKGKFIRTIPQDYVSAAISVPLLDRVRAMTTVRSTRRIWLDDANTERLDNFSSVDFKLTYSLGWVTVELETLNLMNNLFSTTGFFDPGGSDTLFLYPAAGRSLLAGLRMNW